MKKMLKEPLIHFLLIGAALFGISWLANRNESENETVIKDEIVITDATIHRIRNIYQQHTGKVPNSQQLPDLINSYIRQEVLYREALKTGLQKDNDSIRTLLADQMKAAYELAFDSDRIAEPTDEELIRFFIKDRENMALDMPITDTLSAVQTFLKTKLLYRYKLAAKQQNFDRKMRLIEAKYPVKRTDSLQ